MSIKKNPLLYFAYYTYYTAARSHLLCIRASHPSDLWARKKPPVPLCTDYSIKRSENTSTPSPDTWAIRPLDKNRMVFNHC